MQTKLSVGTPKYAVWTLKYARYLNPILCRFSRILSRRSRFGVWKDGIVRYINPACRNRDTNIINRLPSKFSGDQTLELPYPLRTQQIKMGQEAKSKKLRTACDVCHQAKMKCSGGQPCAGCRDSRYACSYSVSNRIGRPKGTKNKRTLERLSRQKPSNLAEQSSSNQIPKSIPTPSRASSCLGSPTSPVSPFSEDVSIEEMLGVNSDFSYPPSTSPAHMRFPDPVDTWCDLEGLSGMGSTIGEGSSSKV